MIDVHAVNANEEVILEGKITVCPPCKLSPIEGNALENF
jgi:hypothetical protein